MLKAFRSRVWQHPDSFLKGSGWRVVFFPLMFSAYISHCSTLAHMFFQACNMPHGSRSSLLCSHPRFTGWMTRSSLTGQSFSCSTVWACVCVCLTALYPSYSPCTKERGHTGASSVRQAATVCSGCLGLSVGGHQALQPSMKVSLVAAYWSSTIPRSVNIKLRGVLYFSQVKRLFIRLKRKCLFYWSFEVTENVQLCANMI